MTKRADSGETLVADNRKAFFDYHVIETFEAGTMPRHRRSPAAIAIRIDTS